ncbi:MAG: RagB/SusD family nutrient uptake outer membrane protein [Sphingobacteriaceae bacterium]|nr:MAG: RagB/SusD family nutrient uptake outer membrane protein [Sphingobacteriaceae bacterium]
MKILNTINKNFKLSAVIIAGVCLLAPATGCKKFLDTQPQGQYTADDYPYPSGSGPYDVFIFAAYNNLRDYNIHAAPFIVATSIRSDDADKGSTPSDGGADVISMDNFPVLPNNGITNALWTGYYAMINNCNTTIDQIQTNTTIVADNAIKTQTEAEARFLRAYGYFMLVRLFGRVPIVDKVLGATQTNVPQSAATAVYSFIEQDLQFAAANLPVSWDAKFIGRATKGAANGMLTKVYLTQQKWPAAMNAANTVMTSGQYDLSTSYDRIFREEGENSKESVFEAQATATAQIPQNNGVQYTNIQGVRGAGNFDLGWGWNTPSTVLESAYEANDPRRTRTILYTTSTSTAPALSIYNEAIPAGLPNPRYNNKVYTNPSFRSLYNNRFGWWMNVRLLRYADVVLMYAEAANEVGGAANTTAALTALNSVRARARNGSTTILPNVITTDQTQLRLAIQQERRIELAMEHDRFFDIVRWGISQTAMSSAGKTNFNASRDNLLPIPQTQIDLSKGILTQNPGY